MANDLIPEEEKNQSGGAMPDFMKGDVEGFEDVDDSGGFPEFKVCTSMSTKALEAGVTLGNIYVVDGDSIEDVGDHIDIVIFKKRTTFQLSNGENNAILCKSYNKETGNCRVYHEEDKWDEDLKEKLGVTDEMIEDEEQRVVTRSCNGCPCHPFDGWTTGDDGKRIPPECKDSHEFYVLYVTDADGETGDFNRVPHLIRITNSSRLKKELLEEIKGLLNRKLKYQGAPLYGGIFRFGSHRVQNARGGKNLVWDVKFESILPASKLGKNIYDFAKTSLKEFNKREEKMAAESEERASQGTSGGGKTIDVDSEGGTAWDDEDEDTPVDTPSDENKAPKNNDSEDVDQVITPWDED